MHFRTFAIGRINSCCLYSFAADLIARPMMEHVSGRPLTCTVTVTVTKPKPRYSSKSEKKRIPRFLNASNDFEINEFSDSFNADRQTRKKRTSPLLIWGNLADLPKNRCQYRGIFVKCRPIPTEPQIVNT